MGTQRAEETYNGVFRRDDPITLNSRAAAMCERKFNRRLHAYYPRRIRLNYTECRKPALNHCHNLLDSRRAAGATRTMVLPAVSIA